MADNGIILNFVQFGINAAAGLLGVGLGFGFYKSKFDRMVEDIVSIKAKQAKLRGEDNNNLPLYQRREDCLQDRHECMIEENNRSLIITAELRDHKTSIKTLENFARWMMQKDGLSIKEINEILAGR